MISHSEPPTSLKVDGWLECTKDGVRGGEVGRRGGEVEEAEERGDQQDPLVL